MLCYGASEADRARALGAQTRKAQSLQDFLGARNNPLVTEKLKSHTQRRTQASTQGEGRLLGLHPGHGLLAGNLLRLALARARG